MKRISICKMLKTPEELVAMAAGIDKMAVNFQPGEYRITVERIERNRTDMQNKFYWSLLHEISEATGNDVDDLHRHFSARYLQDKSKVPARIRSTTELTVTEFIRYLDQIMIFAQQTLNVELKQVREF